MTYRRKKKQDNKNIIGSVVTKVVGAAAIAGVAVAATMALKDEKTRKKVKKVLINVRDQAIDRVETLKTESNDLEENHTIKKIVAGTKKAVKKAKATLSHTEIDGKRAEVKVRKTPIIKGK